MIFLPSIEIGTEFITTAVENYNGRGFFNNFQANRKHAYSFGTKPEDIVDVKCTIIENDVIIGELYKNPEYDSNSQDYFALAQVIDDKSGYNIGLISPNIKVYHICFPYGADVERFYDKDIHDILTDRILFHAGERRAYHLRLKVDKIN